MKSSVFKIPLIKFIPGIAWFFVVLIMICLPKTDLPEVEGWLDYLYIDKWIHIGMFGILAFLFMYPFHRKDIVPTTKRGYFLIIFTLTVCWGLATECIQLYIPGRSFDLLDWVADSSGALLALYWCRKRYLFNG